MVTKARPADVPSALWSKGVKDPFGVHVITEDVLEADRRRTKPVEIGVKGATTVSAASPGQGDRIQNFYFEVGVR